MIEINNTTNCRIHLKKYNKIFNDVLSILYLSDKYVSVAFISANEIKKINKNYRGKNKATDVLSFPNIFINKKWDNKKFKEQDLGEILFCYDIIKKQAKDNKNNIEEETTFMFIHGLLHLLGYEDEKSEEEYLEMNKKQNEIMRKLFTY